MLLHQPLGGFPLHASLESDPLLDSPVLLALQLIEVGIGGHFSLPHGLAIFEGDPKALDAIAGWRRLRHGLVLSHAMSATPCASSNAPVAASVTALKRKKKSLRPVPNKPTSAPSLRC